MKKAKCAFFHGLSYSFVPGQSPPLFLQSGKKVKNTNLLAGSSYACRLWTRRIRFSLSRYLDYIAIV
jgi:hypothetical protein